MARTWDTLRTLGPSLHPAVNGPRPPRGSGRPSVARASDRSGQQGRRQRQRSILVLPMISVDQGIPPSSTLQQRGVIPPGTTLNSCVLFPALPLAAPTKLSYSDARQTLSVLLC